MNIEKLKEHECRFCKNYDGIYCQLPCDACLWQYYEDNARRNKNLPIAWELHPDLAEEETKKD